MGSSGALAEFLLSLSFLLFGLGLLGGGGYFIYGAGKRLLGTAHASITEPVGPGEVSTGGHATVEGEVLAGSETLRSPLSGRQAVAHKYRIEQQTDGVGWWTVADDGHSRPFELQGALGRLSVHPGDEQPAIDTDDSLQVAGGESLPADVRDRLAESDRFDLAAHPGYLASSVTEPRRYEESTLEPGETVYVYGYVTEDGRVEADESNLFRLGYQEPGEMEDEQSTSLRYAIGLGLFGLFLALFGAVATLAGATALSQHSTSYEPTRHPRTTSCHEHETATRDRNGRDIPRGNRMTGFGLLFVVLPVILFGGIGLYVLGTALDRLRDAFVIRQSETVPVREAARRTGVDEFEGTLEPTDDHGTFDAPFSGAEAVLATYEVQRRERKQGSRGNSSTNNHTWNTYATGEITQPFLVRDETGCVEVDPDGADITPANTETRHETGGSLPDSVRLRLSVLTDRLDIDDVLAQNKSNRRRYSEGYIAPGDEVHLYGTEVIERTPGARAVDGRVGNADGASRYKITAGTESDAVRARVVAGIGRLLLGLVLVLTAIGVFIAFSGTL